MADDSEAPPYAAFFAVMGASAAIIFSCKNCVCVCVCHFGMVYTTLYAKFFSVVDVCGLCIACVNNYHGKGFESSFC